ncbi:DUF1289 domain-containing protein [Psychromonas sp. 14N.309.X.WAT.B.A12]|uniref:DUF1289 domain-containing protein n=1 Tax=unclassified Psychromonas TaxID=2614957 RepID=UPI0025AFA983|nr:DUF1289 domain-containing protein [Psychromonas sp. 14N.309.X.WAT.B.A12]MDN2664540.1 DUF1289 domain-containing protein [Psychromonas sp. 14N.309.X.WAT.B.A12]
MNALASPCVGRCCLNNQDICTACYRSLTEITEWSQASDSEKQIIINNISSRRQQSSHQE